MTAADITNPLPVRAGAKPRLAIVSTGIRRDLLAPLKFFREFEIIHFYRRAEYGDLEPDDLTATLTQYHSPGELERLLSAAHADVIQAVEPFSLAQQLYLRACFQAAQLTHARIVAVTLENRPLEIKFNPLTAYVLRRALGNYFARACLIIALNDGARQNLIRSGVAWSRIEKLMWGTWGVDLQEFSRVEPSPQPSPSKGSRSAAAILFAGRLHPEKGIFVLLDAFALVSAQMPEVKLLIAGDGPARHAVELRIRAAPFAHNVTLLGVIKNRAMPDLFRLADVFVEPSLTTRKWEEQVGMSALQAMACGVPIVASKSGAIPEYVPDGIAGLLVAESDAQALADALLKILRDDELRARLSRGAREYACTHYDAQANVENAERVLLERCFESRV